MAEKHEQPDSDDRVVRSLNGPFIDVRLDRLYRKSPSRRRIPVDAGDGSWTGIYCHDAMASASRLQAQVAKPRAKIEQPKPLA